MIMENTEQKASTRSIGLKYGGISALAGVVIFLVVSLIGQNPFGGVWNWIGTGISIVLIVLAHREFKSSGDGFMSFGQGMGVVLWFSIVAVFVSMAVMYIYMNFIDTNAMQIVFDEQIAKMEEQGQSEEAIEMAMEWTKKLFWPMAIVFGFIGSIVIGLIVTIFTQKRNPDPGLQ
jgi:hypothetical protein